MESMLAKPGVDWISILCILVMRLCLFRYLEIIFIRSCGFWPLIDLGLEVDRFEEVDDLILLTN